MGLFGSKLRCALILQPVIDPCAQPQIGGGGFGGQAIGGGFGGGGCCDQGNSCPGPSALRIGRVRC